MVSFTFSAEQVKAAPPEVRRWMESEVIRALAGGTGSSDAAMPESAEGLGHALAAGTAQEMQETFKRVAGNAIIARVFFELARDLERATRHGAVPCRQSRRSDAPSPSRRSAAGVDLSRCDQSGVSADQAGS